MKLLNIVPNPKILFWIAASVIDAPGVNPNGLKTFLANGVSTFYINAKPAVINDLRKLRNSPIWLLLFLVVPFNKIPLFSEKLIILMISFILLCVRVIPEPVIYYLLNLSICLYRIFLLNF